MQFHTTYQRFLLIQHNRVALFLYFLILLQLQQRTSWRTNAQFIDDDRCNRYINVLNIQDALSCGCVTSSRPFGGIDITVQCEQPDGGANFCFGSIFCGSAAFGLSYSIPGGVTDGTICIRDTVLDPDAPTLTLFPNFCITASGRRGLGQGFSSCTVDVEGQVCTCSVCPNGFSFNIECVNGPSLQCFGFNAIHHGHHHMMKMKHMYRRQLPSAPARWTP